jgi:hypothetical protein
MTFTSPDICVGECGAVVIKDLTAAVTRVRAAIRAAAGAVPIPGPASRDIPRSVRHHPPGRSPPEYSPPWDCHYPPT